MKALIQIGFLCLCLCLGLPHTALAADTDTDKSEALLDAALVKRDLDYLFEALQAAHFNLYAHRSVAEYAKQYETMRASINSPMSELAVIKLFTRFVAFGQIGHAKLDFPIPQYVSYLQHGGTLIPLDIRVNKDQVLVANVYGETDGLNVGDELISINGRTAMDWVNTTGQYLSAERPYMNHAQQEAMFPRLFWLVADEVKDFVIETRAVDSEVSKTTKVSSVSPMAVEGPKADAEAHWHSREFTLLDNKIAYLRPGPFYNMEENDSLQAVQAFYDEAFATFKTAGTSDLIIDLRNNPGGDNSFSDPMIAWFADEPFRFASRFIVKASDQTRAVLQKLAEQFPGGISADMAETIESYSNGETFDFEIPRTTPRTAPFRGNVWVLINRHSYSNATTVAAIIQDHDFGQIVGEETSDLPTSYASSARFSLPETGLTVTYPKAYFIRPNGDESLKGVVPDVPLQFDIDKSADEVLDEVVQMIQTRDKGA